MSTWENEIDSAVKRSLAELTKFIVHRVPILEEQQAKAKTANNRPPRSTIKMSDVCVQVMESIIRRPEDTILERQRRLAIDRNQEYRGRRESDRFGLVEEVFRVGQHPFFGPTKPNGLDWARSRGLGTDKFTSSVGIGHWIMDIRIVQGWGTADKRMTFVRGGRYDDVRYDGLGKGPGGIRIPFQISVTNTVAYESDRLVRLAMAAASAGTVLFAVDTKKAEAIRRAVVERLCVEIEEEGERRALLSKILIFDGEAVLNDRFNWKSILGCIVDREPGDSGQELLGGMDCINPR